MKKLFACVKRFVRNSVDCLAPYTVINAEMGKEHFCWSLKEVFEWLECYDADLFGSTHVFNFNGELIARKY